MKNLISCIVLTICVLTLGVSKACTYQKTSTTDSKDTLCLNYLLKEPSVKSNKKKVIVLLHGLGSNEQDLFSLASQLPQDYYIICPRGKYTFSEGSYAWYKVDFSTGKPIYDHQQELESRKSILSFIDQIKMKFGFEEIYLGGFSQGAIMSATIGLLNPEKLKGIICLSGRILQEIQPLVKENVELSKLKIFLAHGIQDGVLPISNVREAKAFFMKYTPQLVYFEYNMGHQIIPEEMLKLKEWLE